MRHKISVLTHLLLFTLLFSLPVLGQTGVSPITDEEARFIEEYRQILSTGEPVKEVQLVYSLSPWDGREYGGTFAAKQADTMYLIADATNIINPLRTEIYYWPITREYMADWFGMREEVPGRLRIRQGDRVVATLDKELYVYSYPEGSMGRTELLIGEVGVAEYERYERLMNEFYDSMNQYYELDAAYRRDIEALLRRVQQTGEYVPEDEVPKAPRQPEAPQMYVMPPRASFIVNLPAGRYQVDVIDENGQQVPGSLKNLEVFAPRREGLGYAVVPEHMWTRAFQTNDPTEVLYLEGRRVFFLQPFEAEEYNQFQYRKMEKLHQPLYGEGARSSWMWIHTQEADPGLRLQILRDGEIVQELSRKPYWVRQTAGYSLGYNIVEFDPDDPMMQGREPTFWGYRVELEAMGGGYTMQMVDANGNVIASSVREIRAIRNEPMWPLYVIPFIPFLVGLSVYARRRSLRTRPTEGPAAMQQ